MMLSKNENQSCSGADAICLFAGLAGRYRIGRRNVIGEAASANPFSFDHPVCGSCCFQSNPLYIRTLMGWK